MGRPTDKFDHADHQRVNQAIQEAESATCAEIVPVVAASSGRYDRPEDIVGVWFAAIGLALVWLVYPSPSPEVGTWDAPAPLWQLVALLAGALFGFVLGTILGSQIDWLRRLFTPRAQMRSEVNGRARAIFFDKRVHHTEGGAGILLYVSLFEQMAAVIADQTVLDKLGQERIDQICREFTQRLHSSTPTDALCATARSLGQQLAPLLPRAADDINELADALVVIA